MAEEYDVQAIMNALHEKEEMDPDQHDGCYELMRETIKAYGKLKDLSALDYKDLNLVYLTTVGTWKQGIDNKKKTVNDSHLMPEDKEYLTMLWDEVWGKAGRGGYTNYELDASGGRSIGLFGTGFFSFQRTTTDNHAQAFIKMCADILPMKDDDAMFDRASEVLTASFKGMKAASASMILHCLKPFSFPVLNSNMGNRNIFEVLGVDLVKKDNLGTYIDNCRKIKAFRDKNFLYKNYRIFDIAAWKVNEFAVSHTTGQFGSWEIVSEDVARLTLDKDLFLYDHVDIPQEITWYFKADGLQTGRKQEIVLTHEYFGFECFIERESVSPPKTRLVWEDDFRREYESYINENRPPVLELRRTEDYRYEIKLVIALDGGEDDFWPSSVEYPVNLSTDDWIRFIQEVEAPKHRGCMRVLACFVDIGGTASPKTLSDKYKGHPSVYIGSVLNTSKRALSYFSMDPCPDGDTQRFFPVAFLGRVSEDVNPGAYEYKMRPELFEALKKLDLSGIDLIYNKKDDVEMAKTDFDHNMILYGPPGTGKTYNSVNYAVAICENKDVKEVMAEPYPDVLQRYREYQASRRISFTTFHQSYGYEEFIEGIRPVMADGDSKGGLDYEIRDGIFKKLCKKAKSNPSSEKEDGEEGSGQSSSKREYKVYLVNLENSERFHLKDRCFNENEIRFAIPAGGSWIRDTVNQMGEHDLVLSYSGNNYIVDGIGLVVDKEAAIDRTQKDLQIVRKVSWIETNGTFDMKKILKGESVFRFFRVIEVSNTRPKDVFDLIEPDIIDKNRNEMAFYSTEDRPHVIIIDEINRGNISKIFGELITLIEETKRAGAEEEMSAILPYSGESFSVPDNVYIIGTMNTADRSIALMDTALRRRFKFVEMMPNTKILDDLRIGTIKVNNEELNVSKMLDIINERIEYLFDREHTIGHAFFTRLKDDPSIDTLADIFEKNIIPLLQEYFYEDYEKIQLVLGDNSKDEEFKFILDRNIKLKDIFNGNPDIDLPEKAYSVQHSAFMKLESYKQIGKGL